MKTIHYLICSFLFATSVYAGEDSFKTKDFSFMKFSSFPSALEDFAFGVSMGYRKCISESNSLEFCGDLSKNDQGELNLCAKSSHRYHFLKNYKEFCPYVGFGALGGLCYMPKDKIKSVKYKPFMNGEVVAGLEFHLNDKTVQLLELTYFAGSSTMQVSFGIGF